MSQLSEAFLNSTIIQAVITLVVVGTICYLIIVGQPIPDFLKEIGGLVIGFYFGAKVQAFGNRLTGPKS